ncbi:MAG: bifunctional oligoribonuclease/PAP phosphatase NrnA [Clostridiales Family XIII bacterium]|jgi:phosphoesterase RecJ-like protein|nr:bifunctional oligoribonuclease/PAP phosphatase NrnA [Clostridiales Family XIII bacterium]
MKTNNTLEEIAASLQAAQSVLLFPHVSLDGDCLGSSMALCAALRKSGKISHVVIEDDIPEFLLFLEWETDCCTRDLHILENPDVCVCMDCGEPQRFPRRKNLFQAGRTTMCIDHHESAAPLMDLNYIDGKAAATAEIVYDLLLLLGTDMDKQIAEAIYTGIVTDTGRFQYSNTTGKTHRIAASLIETDVRPSEIAVWLYQNVSREKQLLESRILGTTEMFAGGKAALAHMTRGMLKETGAKPEDTDGVVEMLRDIRGVEVACLLKERNARQIKVSLRSKQSFDVALLSEGFGGGGHARAAGYTANTNMQEAKSAVKQLLEEGLQ